MSRFKLSLSVCALALSGCGTVAIQYDNMTKTTAGPRVAVYVSGAKVTAFYGASLATTRFSEPDAGWVAGKVATEAVSAHALKAGYVSCDTATVLSSSPLDAPSKEIEWSEEWIVDYCDTTYSVAVNGSGKNNFFSSVKYDVQPAAIVGGSGVSGYQAAATKPKVSSSGVTKARPLANASGPTLDEIYASLSSGEKAKVNRLPPADRADYLASIRDQKRSER